MSAASRAFAALAPPTDGTPNQHELVQHNNDPLHPCNLICDLCRNFYTLGWVTGTGGGISIRDGVRGHDSSAFFQQVDAGACIHTHSQHAVLATLLWKGDEFRISHQEMIKGMRIAGTGVALTYLDTLIIPIIENTPDEVDLKDGMQAAMIKYPNAPAVLVRRHGTYSWGTDWEKAKAQAECLDYLLEVGVKMRLAGLETEGLQ